MSGLSASPQFRRTARSTCNSVCTETTWSRAAWPPAARRLSGMAISSRTIVVGLVATMGSVAMVVTTLRHDAETERLRGAVAALAASVERTNQAPTVTVREYERHTVVERAAEVDSRTA